MLSQSNFQGEVAILRQSCHNIEKDFERKIQQTKNILKQTTLSLQKLSNTKLELFQLSANNCKTNESIQRQSSIIQHKDLQIESESKCSSQNDVKKIVESNQNLSQNPSNFNIQSVQQVDNLVSFAESYQDNMSSKCSIQIDIKAQECSKESENPLMDQQDIFIDGNNELEKRIHQWLDNQGIKMVSPCKKHQDYFDQKRSQINILHKKKQNPISSFQINHDEAFSNKSIISPSKFMTTSLNKQFCNKTDNLQKIASQQNQTESKIGSEIIINPLFNTSITDSPLMQRRKLMLQNTQERDPAQFTSEKKIRNFTTLQLNPANSGVKSSLAHLSQYKRSSPTKSTNEIISSDISTDCK